MVNMSESLIESFDLPSPQDTSLKGEERVLSVLAKRVDELVQAVYEIKNEKVIKETQLPPEVLEHLGLSPNPPTKLKRGRGYRPILAHEILDAKQTLLKSRPEINEAMVAKYLGISYITYKKYAKMYNIWEPKPNIKGKKNIFDPERGKYPLRQILEGKWPNYPVFQIKRKLLQSGLKENKCELCGYKEKRIGDGKTPLILNFLDGNPKNHLLENMKLYCYNCTFTSGKGYIRSGNHYFDPDWLQDAGKLGAGY